MKRFWRCPIKVTIFLALAFVACARTARPAPCEVSPTSKRVRQFNAIVNAYKQTGFNSVDSEACRSGADKARASIFRMLIPGPSKVSLREMLGQDNEAERKKLLASIEADDTPLPSTNPINVWEIQNCLTHHIVDCRISTEYHSSTIVLTGSGQIAQTALHNLRPLIAENKNVPPTAADVALQLSNQAIPAFIFSWNGKLVGDPTTLSVKTTRPLSTEQAQALNLSSIGDGSIATPLDRLTLTLSRTLGPGFPLAKSKPLVGEQLRTFGFPGRTSEWHLVGAKDSDGTSMHCTIGRVILPEVAARKFEWAFDHLPKDMQDHYLGEVVFTDSTSYHGMSGGAVLNEAGELVAIHSSGNDKPLNSVSSHVIIRE